MKPFYPEFSSHLRVTTDPLGVVTTNRTSLVLDETAQKYQTVEETTRAGVKTTTRQLANGEPVTTPSGQIPSPVNI